MCGFVYYKDIIDISGVKMLCSWNLGDVLYGCSPYVIKFQLSCLI